jgi:hypothetical protein
LGALPFKMRYWLSEKGKKKRGFIRFLLLLEWALLFRLRLCL